MRVGVQESTVGLSSHLYQMLRYKYRKLNRQASHKITWELSQRQFSLFFP